MSYMLYSANPKIRTNNFSLGLSLSPAILSEKNL